MFTSTVLTATEAVTAAANDNQPDRRPLVTCVIGLGGIGILVATAIGDGTEDRLIAVGRRNQVGPIEYDGLHRTGLLGDVSLPPGRITVFDAIDGIPEGTVFDCVLICVKCYDVAEVARQLALRPDLIRPDTLFFCFLNGWNSHEPLLQLTDAQHIYHAVVMTGVARSELNQAKVAVHQREILLGSLATGASLEPAKILAEDLSNGGVPARATPDICRFVWDKVLFNAGVNGMCAVNECSIGELVKDAKSRMRVERLLRESFRVIKRAGYATGHGDVDAYLAKFYGILVPKTAEHKSSMYHDLRRDMPRTEVEWINGAILVLARENFDCAPENEKLIEEIHAMESQRRRARFPLRAASSLCQENEVDRRSRA